MIIINVPNLFSLFWRSFDVMCSIPIDVLLRIREFQILVMMPIFGVMFRFLPMLLWVGFYSVFRPRMPDVCIVNEIHGDDDCRGS